jgi:hypothetical protein
MATQGDPEAQLAKGLRFELFGAKLKGGWHLVKPARQPQWLLFKDDDEFASDIEADDLLGTLLKRPGGPEACRRGKTAKKKLTVRTRHTHPTKELGEEGPGAQQGEKAAAPSGPFEPQLAKLGDTPPQGGSGCMRSNGMDTASLLRWLRATCSCGRGTHWNGPASCLKYVKRSRHWAHLGGTGR